jgi:hypothetical protein
MLMAYAESPAPAWPALMPEPMHVHCASCGGAIELACEGLGGTVIYKTYREYFCPHCHKQNHARVPGRIISSRPRPSGDERTRAH